MTEYIKIRKNSYIKTLPLINYKENKNIIIGTYEYKSSFINTSDLGLEAIKLMNEGYRVLEVEQKISKKYKKKISIKGLIKALYDANLIYSINNIPQNQKQRRLFKNKSFLIKISKALFSRTAYVIYALVFCLAISIIVFNTNLLTSFSMYLNKKYLMYDMLVVFFIGWLLTLKHEFFHFLASLSFGIPANISFSTRYFIIVLETDVSGLYMVQKKSKKIIVYLAGIISDIITISLLVLLKKILFLYNIHTGGMIIFLIDISILESLLGILFQFNVFLKTDLYFFFIEIFNIKNLYKKSGEFIKYLFSFKKSKNRKKVSKVSKVVVCFSIFRIINYIILSLILFLCLFGLIIIIYNILYTEHKIITTEISKLEIFYQIFSIAIYFVAFILIKLNQKSKRKPVLKITF